jgi:hypothetical protein
MMHGLRLSVPAVLLFALVWVGGATSGEPDSVIAVAPLDLVLTSGDFDSCSGLVISPEALLVVVPEAASGHLLAAGAINVLGLMPPLPLWMTPDRVSEDTVRETGIHVLYTTGSTTVFEADPGRAHHLRSMGHSVVRIKLRPIYDLKRPHFGTEAVERLLSERPLTEARKRFIRSLSDSVDTLLIRNTLFDLTYDEDLGQHRSRYACRVDLNRDIAPYIIDRLTTYVAPHGGSVLIHDCLPIDSPCGAVPLRNIAAVRPGKRTSAYYLICAHYDATGSHEPGWDPDTDPAPGADDNASGVVAVLECARLLSGLDFDVGLSFVAFSGEELGLLGSECYVDGLSEEDSILGVINFDMVGYTEIVKRIDIAYDWRSEWLSALIDDMAGTLGIDSTYTFNQSGIPTSDHASFWVAGIPGVMLADRTNKSRRPVYPYYHTLGDTLENLNMGQIADNVALVAGFLARFALLPGDSLSDLLLTGSSIECDWEGRDFDQPLVAGEAVTATVRAVNIGAAMPESAVYNFEVWVGELDRGRLIHRSTPLLELASGQPTDLSVSWDTDPETHGTVVHSFRLLPAAAGVESDLGNNSATAVIEVMTSTGVIDDLHVFPNPITGGSDPMIAFDIFHPKGDDFKGTMEIWIFDLEGRQIGYGSLTNTYVGDPDMAAGEGGNQTPLSRFLTSESDLPPGLYICIAELKSLGEERRATARTKFAVAR